MTVQRLHRADLEALADLVAVRVVELLRVDDGSLAEPATGALIDAREVAGRYGVSAEWVRDNADTLGAVRLGTGARPRLRFDPEKVAAALTADEQRRGSQAPHPPPRRRKTQARPPATANGCPLLPVRGSEA